MSGAQVLDANQRRAVDQVRVLWPYLRFDQRLEWASRLKPWFGHDFAVTVRALQDASAEATP